MQNTVSEERLVAYLAGELGPEETAAVEAAIANDPKLHYIVADLREVITLSHEAFMSEPETALTLKQRETILATAEREPAESAVQRPKKRSFLFKSATAFALAAASFLILVSAIVLYRYQSNSAALTIALNREKELVEKNRRMGYLSGPSSPTPDLSVPSSLPPAPQQAVAVTAAKPEPSKGVVHGPSDAYTEVAKEKKSETPARNDGDSLGLMYTPAPQMTMYDSKMSSTRDFYSLSPAPNAESYSAISENPFQDPLQTPLSTFSIDTDTASYSNVRRFLSQGSLPPADAVRIEELVNYFPYAYSPPENPDPFASRVEVAMCPWAPEHRLVRVALKGREIPQESRPPMNLVFLMDVSGSMNAPNKLPLVKQAMRLIVNQMTERDSIAIAVYASGTGLPLPSTNGSAKNVILNALDNLEAGGSTNGAGGIQLAYQTARQSFVQGGVNRVILATDGDFNVGMTNEGELVRLIEENRQSGVFLTVLGFGMGNLKDSMLEKLADKGNGSYAYIDNFAEARKVFLQQLSGSLVTIAKDVKIQVEFNPTLVRSYRLIGYENRTMAAQDFNDDRKDAGEIGAGHTVTAFYEVVPQGASFGGPGVDPLKYQQRPVTTNADTTGEMLTLKLRYKQPNSDTSQLLTFPVRDTSTRIEDASQDFRFAASVAAFGMVLRNSQHQGTASLNMVRSMAEQSIGPDPGGHRAEFLQLVISAQSIAPGE